jgi:hypothetical protein
MAAIVGGGMRAGETSLAAAAASVALAKDALPVSLTVAPEQAESKARAAAGRLKRMTCS